MQTVVLSGEFTAGWNGTYSVIAVGDSTHVTISLNSSGLGAFAGTATLTPIVPVQGSAYVSAQNQDLGINYSDIGSYGQDRVVVLSSATPITAGHITATCNDGDQATCAFTGDSTAVAAWGSLTSSGSCISLDADTFTSSYGSGQRPWYPINGVNLGASQITVFRYTASGIANRTSGSWTYQILPCGQIGYLDVVPSPNALAVQGMALYYNPVTWTVGGTFLQPIDPWGSIQHSILSTIAYFGPVASLQSNFRATNDGSAVIRQAYVVDAGYNTHSTNTPDWLNAINVNGNTQNGVIALIGKDSLGPAMSLGVTPGDNKCLHWEGAGHDASEVCGGSTGIGATINSDGYKLKLGTTNSATSGTFDYSALGTRGSATWTLPNSSGLVALDNPGAITVTLPDAVGGAIEFGYFQGGATSADGSFSADIAVGVVGGGQIANQSYRLSLRTDQGPSCVWSTVTPFTDAGTASTLTWRLDVLDNIDCDGTVHFRLTRTASGGTGLSLNVYLKAYGSGIILPFVATPTNTSTPATPTRWQPTTVLRQHDNKVDVVNAGGFAATIDPGNLTAARAITLPNAGGTPLLYQGNTTGSTAFAPGGSNCPAANCATPYTWMQVTTADGSTGYIPVFK